MKNKFSSLKEFTKQGFCRSKQFSCLKAKQMGVMLHDFPPTVW